jgi:predicted nucleic acid-binding protein
MPVVVSDTSPVRALAHLGLLRVLPSLFGRVLIPPGVVTELATPPAGMILVTAADLPFADVRAPADHVRVAALKAQLDLGEAEALALALEVRADLVLIDEAAARATAASLGLTYTGALGLLVRAKRAGLIAEVRPLLDSLEHGLRFFIDDPLRQLILQLAGE